MGATNKPERFNRMLKVILPILIFVLLGIYYLEFTTNNWGIEKTNGVKWQEFIFSNIAELGIILAILLVLTRIKAKNHILNEESFQHNQVEKELSIYIALMGATLESINNGILVVDLKGRVIKTNSRFAEMWFIPKELLALGDDEKLLNYIFDQLSEPDVFIAKVKQLYGEPYAGSLDQLSFKDGRVFERVSKPMLIQGEPKGRVWSFRDITHRITSEKVNRESENKYRELVEQINDVIFTTNEKGILTYISPSVEQFWGYQPDEMIGHSMSDFLDPDFVENLKEQFQKVMKGIKEPFEYRVKTKSGETPWVRSSSRSVIDNGKPVGIRGALTDITERKQVEELLQNERTLFRTVIDLIPDAIYVKNAEGQKTLANPKEVELTGLESEAEVIGKSDNAIYSVTSSNKSQQEDSYILKTGNPIFNIEGELIDKKGQMHYLLGSKVALRDVGGNIIGLVGINHDITERKKAEDLLWQSEERFRSVTQTANDAIITASSDGKIIDWNIGAERIFGYKDFEMVGQSLEKIIPENYRNLHNLWIKGMEGNGEKQVIGKTVELRGLSKNRIRFPIEVSLSGWKTAEGQFFTAIIRDVTERKQVEKEIMMLANAMKSINECVSITDMEEAIVFVNESFLKTYGYAQEELIGKNISLVRTPNSSSEMNKLILPSTLNGGWEGELLNVKKDGSVFSIHLSTSVIHNADSKPLALIGVALDITERKQAEKILEQSEERYRTLFNNIGEGIAFVNSNEVFEFANPVAEAIFGAKGGELKGKSLNEFLSEEQFAIVLSQTQTRKQGVKSSYEIELKHPNGDTRFLLISAVPQFDELGIFTGSYGVFRDVTDQKKAELTIHTQNQELLELNNTKNKFFSIIAHDLKSPFNTLLGYAELLHKNIRKYEINKVEMFIESMYLTIIQTNKLLINLLDWGLNQQNRISYNPVSHDLKALATEMVILLKPTAGVKNITIELEIETPCFALCDSYMIEVVLRNLISNAIKFTREGGVIKIAAKKQNSMILVSVADNGVGIKPEVLETLFQIAKNTSQPGTRGEKGTGLGLILCKEFVEKHGGQIWVEGRVEDMTQRKAGGSTFYFTLPYFPEEQEPGSKEISGLIDNAKKPIKDLKILIVEDDEASSQYLAELVAEFSKELLYAKNGNEAVECCKNNPNIDLVLMDIRMPGMDGYEATRQIRQFNKDIRIFVQTAYFMADDSEKALEAGCNEYLSKPINPSTLFDFINAHFNRN